MGTAKLPGFSSASEVIHKEKNQKKYNKTTGQHDKLKKYSDSDTKSSDKLTTQDKVIGREARYMKNIRIDKAYESLLRMNLVVEGQNRNFYFKTLHKLGVTFVMAQAELAMKNGRKPDALFHFLINKELNRVNDPYMPRF